jgi:hypothetical protein
MLWAGFAVIASAIAWIIWATVRYVRALRALAAERGWTFVQGDAHGHVQGFTGPYALFRQGREGTAHDVLRGDAGGYAVEVFGYRYVVRYGARPASIHQTVVHVEDPTLRLPAFSLRPAGGGPPLPGMEGFVEVALSDSAEFPAGPRLRAPDGPATAARFTPDVLDALAAAPGLSVDGGDGHLFVFREGKVTAPAAIPAGVDEALRLAAAFRTTPPVRGPVDAGR